MATYKFISEDEDNRMRTIEKSEPITNIHTFRLADKERDLQNARDEIVRWQAKVDALTIEMAEIKIAFPNEFEEI